MEGRSTLVDGMNGQASQWRLRRIYACAGSDDWLVIRGSDEGETQNNRDEEADSGYLYSLD